jgi:hypothetical protein
MKIRVIFPVRPFLAYAFILLLVTTVAASQQQAPAVPLVTHSPTSASGLFLTL